MAITLTSERYAQSLAAEGASSTFSPASNITAGSFAVMLITTGAPDGKVVSSVTDSVGNTWAVDVAYDAVASNKNINICSCQVATQISTAATITANYAVSGNNQVHIWVEEFAGIAAASAFDKSATGSFASTTPVTGSSGTLTQANELVIAALRHDDLTGWTKDASYTATTTAMLSTFSVAMYKIVSATTATTAGGTVTNSGDWAIALASYKPAVAASGSLTWRNVQAQQQQMQQAALVGGLVGRG